MSGTSCRTHDDKGEPSPVIGHLILQRLVDLSPHRHSLNSFNSNVVDPSPILSALDVKQSQLVHDRHAHTNVLGNQQEIHQLPEDDQQLRGLESDPHLEMAPTGNLLTVVSSRRARDRIVDQGGKGGLALVEQVRVREHCSFAATTVGAQSDCG